jgi:hypothetical protein
MPHNFVKLYHGNPISVLALFSALEEIGITPLVKDPSESARLAGFGSMTSEQSLWVHNDELEKANKVLSGLGL